MMTNVTESDRFPRWRFFGPWPLQPLPVAAIIGLMSVAIGLVPVRWLEQWPNYLTGVVVFLVTWMLLSAASRLAPRLIAKPLGYVLVFTIAAVLITIVRAVADVLPGSSDLSQRVAAAIITSTLFLILVQGILGTSSARLRREVSRANEAVDQLREQQTALLRADEHIRQQVAVVLHDQVQAGLVSACMKLQRVREIDGASDVEKRVVSDVVTQLEQLRSLDLRKAVRSLSPNLRDVDMHTALEELAETWGSAMTVTITIHGQLPPIRDLRLGAYRIIEQALLNSAGHGTARTCHVTIDVGDDVTVTVDDDGTGMNDPNPAGLGSTLVSTWCTTLGGSWGYQRSPLGGVRVVAHLAVST
jgi:signal transduction histidine kinase